MPETAQGAPRSLTPHCHTLYGKEGEKTNEKSNTERCIIGNRLYAVRRALN
jgi:hypothetical protein